MATMEDLVASVKDIKFDIETYIEHQVGIQPLPFLGMDKSGSAVCDFFFQGNCARGHLCPFRHTIGEKAVVCKHWLRGLCKKGDECEFLHEYDMSKMPECYFFARFGTCNNKECPFLHVDPMSKRKACPWYDRGFCKHGSSCKNKHVRRVMCLNYLCGFCPEGPSCKHMHPRFDLPLYENRAVTGQIICHACGEPGHKLTQCPTLKQMRDQQVHNVGVQQNIQMPRRPLEFVTCFKCRQRGHYANRCPFPAADPSGMFRPRFMMPQSMSQSMPPPQQPPAPPQMMQTIPTLG
eukprot:Seg1670.6 transcript_id=Seg1670.6/GoldUCD/mRNA.D3Y31 product="Cleavage and polyadenylation specificity factor subunit 4" protein_id=Seg1670.6/GoldUCD/D3Y31